MFILTGNYHIPVLLEPTLDFLITDQDGTYLDCTLGGGGHSRKILETISSNGHLYSVDQDIDAINHNQDLLAKYPNLKIKNIPFSEVIEMEEISFGLKFDGILMDLGISSRQIDNYQRGFSYLQDSDLDMRMDKENPLTAEIIVNEYDFEQILEIFKNYGEDKFSFQIAKAIIKSRSEKRIKTTFDLAKIVTKTVPHKAEIKSLSRIFQALRIEVNDELGELKNFLSFSLEILKPKGRFVVIAYHSLEDRIVKNFINENSKGCICPVDFPKCVCGNQPKLKKITRKVVIPSANEIKDNSRARSAKLRVFEKI